MKNFTKHLISNVFMSINDTRISIIVYSTSPLIELSFDEPYSSVKVDKLRLLRGFTYIDKALIMADQLMFRQEKGMRRHSKKVPFCYLE